MEEPNADARGRQLDRKRLVFAAYDLQRRGLNPIALTNMGTSSGKKPFVIKGELKDDLFHRRSNGGDIQKWIARSNSSKEKSNPWRWENLGLVMGHTSGRFAVDVDDEAAWAKLALLGVKKEDMARTPSWSTGRGGQLCYLCPSDTCVPKLIGFLPGVDIIGERSFSAIPPSVHANGKPYEYLTSFETPTLEAPPILLNAIRLASGDGLSNEEYAQIPPEIKSSLSLKSKSRSTRGPKFPKGYGAQKNGRASTSEELLEGYRNEELFSRACRYRHIGYNEQMMLERLRKDNGIYANPPLDEEEVERICKKVCVQYPPGPPLPEAIQMVLRGIDNYYRMHPPKGQSKKSDHDLMKALADELLLHTNEIVDEGVDVSISLRQLAEKMKASKTTVKNSLDRQPEKVKRSSKKSKRGESGSLIILKDFYSNYASLTHSTPYLVLYMGGSNSYKSRPELSPSRNRGGGGRFGKAKRHLLDLMEEVLGKYTEEEVFSPKELVAMINLHVQDPKEQITTNSISGHLAFFCEEEVGILERIAHGKYRRLPDRYKNLGDFMRDSGEFEADIRQKEGHDREREADRDRTKRLKEREEWVQEEHRLKGRAAELVRACRGEREKENQG